VYSLRVGKSLRRAVFFTLAPAAGVLLQLALLASRLLRNVYWFGFDAALIVTVTVTSVGSALALIGAGRAFRVGGWAGWVVAVLGLFTCSSSGLVYLALMGRASGY
jgi:hypothetical protein